jgi:hypothetical protein
MKLLPKLVPLGFLAFLVLTYFSPLVFNPSFTFYSDHSDLIALHVPWEMFLSESYRAFGETPLWNPLQFSGLPFVHDIQAAIFYPPHLVFRHIQPSTVGAALSWLIVFHVLLAGSGMYLYQRHRNLGSLASFVSAIGFMFGGKWLLHLMLAGHYAFVGLAWLPWILLTFEKGLVLRSYFCLCWSGTFSGLMLMSLHPQLSMYSCFFIILWTFPFVLHSQEFTFRERLFRWVFSGIFVVFLGLAIAAIQIFPFIEAIPLSSRGVQGIPEVPSISLRGFLRAIGPSPDGVQPVISWEPRSGFGMIWIVVGLMSLKVCNSSRRNRTAWALMVFVLLSLFSLGGAGIFKLLPLFQSFRQPSRMFLIAAFSLAELAGIATQSLLEHSQTLGSFPKQVRSLQKSLLALSLCLLAVSAFSVPRSAIQFHLYWISLIVTIPIFLWIFHRGLFRKYDFVLWALVLLIDQTSQTISYVRVRSLVSNIPSNNLSDYLANQVKPLDRVLDRNLPGHQSTTPFGPAISTKYQIASLRGYNALDLLAYKQFISFIAYPTSIRQPYNGIINFPIHNKSLLDLLGVRFLIEPKGFSLANDSRNSLATRTIEGWKLVHTDTHPRAFTFASGGMTTFPPYEILENQSPFPRAFVVSEIRSLPQGLDSLTQAMISTNFREVAFVEDSIPNIPNLSKIQPKDATIVHYSPNQIIIVAEGPGLLVVTDPWYPGWTVRVDGLSVPLHRTNFLFRGVFLYEGKHEIKFQFEPNSFRIGRLTTIVVGGFVSILSLISLGQQINTLRVIWTLRNPMKRDR